MGRLPRPRSRSPGSTCWSAPTWMRPLAGRPRSRQRRSAMAGSRSGPASTTPRPWDEVPELAARLRRRRRRRRLAARLTCQTDPRVGYRQPSLAPFPAHARHRLVVKMSDEVTAAYRAHWARAVAVLCRWTGDVDLAEDAVQDAAEQALRTWPRDGVPDHPDAWLITTARRRAIDRLRRDRRRAERTELLARLEALDRQASLDHGQPASGSDNDQLTLILICCHPALGVDAQVALTLRAVAGLAPAEIARAFLVPERTLQQRLVRAKRKIAIAASRSVSRPTTSSPTGSGPSARSC